VKRTPLAAITLSLAAPAPQAFAYHPLSYLHGFGDKAATVASLTWGVLILSAAVVLAISILLAAGVWRRGNPTGRNIRDEPVKRGGNGLRWIGLGVGVSSVLLFGSLIWTVVVLAETNGPPRPPRLTIEITGQQFWWKARYLNQDASRTLTVANEIHIPVGEPVFVKLIGADVIHSFWVPALTGKTDAIPGQVNTTWLDAAQPGTYSGQCTEYCGQQHAHMGFTVVADTPQTFEVWFNEQLKPAPPPVSERAAHGEQVFVFRCGACHTVRGTDAGGSVAPDLTHVMSRGTLAAGMLPNTLGNLLGWIGNPQAIKPGTKMPAILLSGAELTDVGAYVGMLK
jgi:cytochrome c oxidase subunit 2